MIAEGPFPLGSTVMARWNVPNRYLAVKKTTQMDHKVCATEAYSSKDYQDIRNTAKELSRCSHHRLPNPYNCISQSTNVGITWLLDWAKT